MSASISTFDSTDPIHDVVSALKRDGGVVLRNLVPEELMDEIYAEVMANTPESSRETEGTEVWPEGHRTVGALAAVSPTFTEKLLLHPKTLEVADALLLPIVPMSPDSSEVDTSGDFVEMGLLEMLEDGHGGKQLMGKATDPEKGPNCHHYVLGASVMLEVHRGGDDQFLHRESVIYQPFIQHLSGMRNFVVSVNWAGTDFTRENGATRLVPGSHEWPESRLAEPDEVIQAEMSKGSALIWLTRTLHGAGKNTTDRGRTALFGSYVADWLRQEENQYLTVPPEVASRMSERAQQIIGYRCSPHVGWVKGRSGDNLLVEGKSSPI